MVSEWYTKHIRNLITDMMDKAIDKNNEIVTGSTNFRRKTND